MMTDMTLMHLMCAKICHDLAAPAGAVVMGLEMMSGSAQDPAMVDLLNHSAQSTTAKLEVFRCLTGFSGMPDKPTGHDVNKALGAYWPDQKHSVLWKAETEAIQGPVARLVLACLLTAADGLPRGGTLTVENDLRITAQGPVAHLRDDLAQAITGHTPLSRQTAGTIVAFLAHILASRLGKGIQLVPVATTQFQIAIQEKVS